MTDTKQPTPQETMEKVTQAEKDMFADMVSNLPDGSIMKSVGARILRNLTLCEHQAQELQRKDEALEEVYGYLRNMECGDARCVFGDLQNAYAQEAIEKVLPDFTNDYQEYEE
jgi:hypothetical protein